MNSSGTTHRPGVLRHAVASALRIDWRQAEPLAALRCTVAVALPLAVSLALGRPAAGVFATIGAVSVGFGSFQGSYRSRAGTMLLAAVAMGFSLFVGTLAGHSTILAVTVAALWGLAAGLLVALGPAASFVGLQSALAVLVAGGYPADVGPAAARGLLVVAGGLVQTIFVVGLWPVRRFAAERRAVSDVYRSLADYARTLARPSPTAPEPHTLAQVVTVASDRQPFARPGELLVFPALLDEADRIRAGLAALSLWPEAEREAVAEHLAAILGEIASAVREARAPATLASEWTALRTAASRIRDRALLESILGQLRAACRTAMVPTSDRPRARPSSSERIRTMAPVRDAIITLRANVTLESAVFRHALRLSVALALATAIYRVTELPRGYWFSLTVLLVLKPDFRDTFVAAVTRVLGTVAGAGLAAMLIEALGSHHNALVALLLVFVWGAYTLFRANFVAFTICITGYIVVLLTLSGVPGPPTATYRVIDTALGGALALAVYRLWPTWESSRVREFLATLVEAQARDIRSLLGMYVNPTEWDPKRLTETRAAARLARSNAEASVDRLLDEPASRERLDPQLAQSLLASFRRYALGALALHAGLDTRPPRPTPDLERLRDQLTTSLNTLAHAIRNSSPPGALPPLRETQLAVHDRVDATLAEQTDIMVDSVNTAAALLDAAPVRPPA